MPPPPSARTNAGATVDDQLDLLLRGVEYGDRGLAAAMRAELAQRLRESGSAGRPLTVYVGIDPTGSDLTLGHTVPLRKLRQFQDLGHRGIFVVGSFTARIGDPSDKTAARPQLTEEAVRQHAEGYVQQAMRVLDPERTEVRYNSDWLAALHFEDVIRLASHFTVGQFLQRDNFRARHSRGGAIWLHEFFYALMQAYDAVELRADVQIGGTEQLFNLMAGRKLQEAFGQRPQVPITMPILVGTDGVARMSKSSGNYVAVAEPPQDQYGKTMSLPDAAMANWFNLVTSLTPERIRAILAEVAEGALHPMSAKKQLAEEIVSLFHGPAAAEAAASAFARTVQDGAAPDEMPEVSLTEPRGLLELLHSAGVTVSNSEARRLVLQGAVKIDGTTVTEPGLVLQPGPSRVIQAGRRRYLRVVGRG
jgi:tyrosyl-tRNA synthetase